MCNRDNVIKLYEYLYREVSGNKNYIFKSNDQREKMISNFCEALGHNYGVNWLYDFFCFQFSKYHDRKTKFGTGKVMLNWVVSLKAVKYYNEAPDEERYWGHDFKRKYKLKNPLLKREKIDKSYLDIERRRWYNTDLGLLHCKDLGLFRKRNKNCMLCKNKKYCDES